MISRRNFIKLTAVGGGAVFMSGLYGPTQVEAEREDGQYKITELPVLRT